MLPSSMAREFKLWFGGLIVVASFAIVAIFWLDKPTAFFIHDLFGDRRVPSNVTGSPIFSVPTISTSIFVLCGIAAICGRQFSRLEVAVILSDISVLIATAIKDQLKIVFGRTWPDSWAFGIRSLIHDHAYEFHFFQSGRSFEAFPSGHAAVVAAAMSTLWILFPRLRIVYALCIAATDVALVLMNLHFISDVVVGTFVGISSGLFVAALWRMKSAPF